MQRKIILILAIALILTHQSSAVKTFFYNETDKVSLAPSVSDPDNDAIQLAYTPPLDANGEWQTSYGNAGQYNITITVSDGSNVVSEEILVIVEKKEEPPIIISSSPEADSVEINENEAIKFSIDAQDPNKDDLKYQWFLDNDDVAEAKELNYKADYNSAGEHNLTVVISDSKLQIERKWVITVNNVDFEGMIESISDIIINEGEVARAELPDFGKYGLKYELSEPLGADNRWKTGYGDGGIHKSMLKVYSDDFSMEKEITISVHNLDRPLSFGIMGIKTAAEGRELRFDVKAEDPDGNAVSISLNNPPEGARLEGSTFIWTPGFDAVKQESLIGGIQDRFRILQKVYLVEFTAKSSEFVKTAKVPVVVWDANRAPVIDELPQITVAEGDIVDIQPKYHDPDGDNVKVSYSGWLDSNSYKTTFDDQGVYYVKVAVSDGLLESSGYVKINVLNNNRKPKFLPIRKITAVENETVRIMLAATDDDSGKLKFSITNPPENSVIRDNEFIWTPPYSFTDERGSAELEFEVSDGESKASQKAVIEVINKNQPPIILSSSPKDARIKAGQPVTFEIRAEDKDGDKLAYKWDFGFFEKYNAGSKHKRVFSSKGNKKVKVTVTDGRDAVENVWNIEVI